jgi:hypothetical protein
LPWLGLKAAQGLPANVVAVYLRNSAFSLPDSSESGAEGVALQALPVEGALSPSNCSADVPP